MKSNWIIIAIICGLAAAVLHASVTTITPLTALLFYLAPLPLLMAGLSHGWPAAMVSGAVGALAMAGFGGVYSGFFFLAASAVGPVILSRLALTSRQAQGQAGEGEATAQGLQWYPEGRLVLWSAAMAGALLTFAILALGPNTESFQATMSETASAISQSLGAGLAAEQQAELKEWVDFMMRLAPAAAAAAWLAAMTINLFLASRLLTRLKMSARPWAPFSSLMFPRKALLGLAGASVASLLPGTAGFIGMAFAAPLLTAFAILGLSVVHHLLVGHMARTPILVGLYATLIVLSWVLALPLILLGIVELGFGVRARLRPLPPVKPNT